MRRWSPIRLGMLLGVGALCLGLQLAGIGTRFGVIEHRGAYFYVRPFDSARIDNLNMSDPGPRFALLGLEFNKLYRIYPYPWHARVSPCWVIFAPIAFLACFVPRLGARKTAGFEPVIRSDGERSG